MSASQENLPGKLTQTNTVASSDDSKNTSQNIGDQTSSTELFFKRIQELERLVDTISRSKMIWEGTFDVIADPVLIIDNQFHITRANLALARASSSDVRKVIGKKCYEIFAGRNSPCVKCPVAAVRKSDEPQSIELDPFSNQKQYSATAYAIQFDGNEEIVLHYLDITDAKRMHHQLLQSEKMVAIGTLAGGIAHEINNPLGGILAFAQLAMRQLEKDHPVQTDLHEIEQAALRCKDIVRNLLDFSRQTGSDIRDAVDLNTIINRTLPMVKMNARDTGVEILVKHKNNLPHIWANAQKIQQVLINLITNGLHAMKGQGGALTITTDTKDSGRRVTLAVADEGIGIPKNIADKIFDPFFTTKDQGEGTGLGLSICYGILKEHDANIEFAANKNKGSIFTITFIAHENP